MTDVGVVKGGLELEDMFSGTLNLFGNLIAGIGMGAGMKIFDTLSAGVKKFADAIPQATRAAMEEQDAIYRLSAALKSQGDNTEEAIQQLEDQSSALSRVTTASDDSIRAVQNRMIVMGQSREQTLKSTQAVLDFARVTGVDATSAVGMFTMALSGRGEGFLRRYGLEIDNTIPKAQRMAALLEEVNKKFGGSAGINTFADRVKNLQTAMGEMWDSAGAGIVSSGKLNAAFDGLREVAWKVVDAIKANEDTIRDFVNGSVLIAVDALVALSRGLKYVSDAWGILKIGTLQASAVVAQAGAAILNVNDEITGIITSLEVRITQLAVYFDALRKTMADPLGGDYFEAATAKVNLLDRALQITSKQSQEARKERTEAAKGFAEEMEAASWAERQAMADREQGFKDIEDAAENFRDAVANANDEIKALAVGPGTKPPPPVDKEAVKAFTKTYTEALRSITSATTIANAQMAGSWEGGLAQIEKSIEDMVLKADDLQEAATKAGAAFDKKKYMDAVDGLKQAQTASLVLQVRQQLLGQTYGDVESELDQTSNAIVRNNGLQGLTAQSLMGLRDKWTQYRAQLEAAGESTEDADELLEALNAELAELNNWGISPNLLDGLNKMAAISGAAVGALEDLGLAGGRVGEIAGGLAKSIGGVSEGLAGIASGNPVAIISGVGKAFGGLKDAISGAFRDKEWEAVNDMRDSFEDSIGTFDEFAAKLTTAGAAELIPEYLAARTEEAWEKVQEKIQDALAAEDTRAGFIKAAGGIDELTKAADKAGVSLKGLTDARTQKEVDEYIEKFEELRDLQAQLKDLASEAFSKMGENMLAAVDTSGWQKVELKAALDTGEITQEQFDEVMKQIKPTGIQILTAADARSQATIAMLAFDETVKKEGLLAAAEAFKPVAESLRASIEAVGGPGSAEAMLGPMFEQIKLAGNDAFRGAVEGAQGFAGVLQGFRAEQLPMTIQQLGAFGQQAQSAFAQAVSGGASSQQALTGIAPLLQQMKAASEQYGIELDSNTQALIDQAEAAGIAFPEDPINKMVEAINRLIVQLGGEVPEAATVAANSMAGTFEKTSTQMEAVAGGVTKTFDTIQKAGETTTGSLVKMTEVLTTGWESVKEGTIDAAQAMQEFSAQQIQMPSSDWFQMPGVPSNIPHHRLGGMQIKPHLAVVGEVPEMITPLSEMQGGGGGGLNTLTMQSLLSANNRNMTRMLRDALNQAKRS